MAFRLTPQNDTFYDLFTASAELLVGGSRALTALLASTPEDRGDVVATMRDLELQADEATHAILRRINGSFITPFDRADIHALADALDDCMDFMEAAVDLIDIYQLEALPKGVARQVDLLGRMADLTAAAMPSLRELSSLGDYLIEINRLENEGDRNHRRLLAKVMDENADNVIRVLKVKGVIDELKRAIDGFERVAHVVESMALKGA